MPVLASYFPRDLSGLCSSAHPRCSEIVFTFAAGHKDLIELLVKRKANLQATNGKQQTPLDVAKNAGTKQLLQQLLAAQPPQGAASTAGKHAATDAVSQATSGMGSMLPVSASGAAEDVLMGAADLPPVQAIDTGRPQPSAASSAEQEASQAQIGPMLPPGAVLATDGPSQEPSTAQIGPELPPGMVLHSEGPSGGPPAAQAAADQVASRSDTEHNAEESFGAPQVAPSNKAAAHVRRSRRDIEADGQTSAPAGQAPAKKARVALAHLDDEEDEVA